MVQEVEAGRAEESGFSLGVAVADDDAAGLDCGAAEHGDPRSSGVVAAATGQGPARRSCQPTIAKKMTLSLSGPAPLTELHDAWWNSSVVFAFWNLFILKQNRS